MSPNVPDIWAWEPWANGVTHVTVTYAHGYDEALYDDPIPDSVIGVVCQVAARALDVAGDDATVQSESVGSYSYSMGAAAASGAFGLLLGERQILDRFRRPGQPVSMHI